MDTIKINKIEKQTVKYLNKTAYLLGERKDGEKVYLQAGSWDCGWYWGYGYLEIYNKPRTDIVEHYHFDSLLKKCGLDGINEHFKSFTLNENEIWILADLMKSFYNLKEAAEFYHRGGSNYATPDQNLKDLKMYKRINTDIESIIKQVEKLLS